VNPLELTPTDPVENFVLLLAQHERMLAAYVLTLVPHFQDADDILQDTKVVMWRNFAQFRLGTNFGAWARKIAFHQVLSHRKRKKRDRLEFSEEFLHAVADEVETGADYLGERQAALNQCVAKLSDEQRQLLRFRYQDQLEIDVLASRLDRTVTATYRTLSRIRQVLHECVTRSLNKTLAYERELQPD
jgi:RNA polymerase sigma-70 factor, ECF subfamily